MKRTIVQSSHLKSILEKFKLKRNNCTICSLDIINMYPSIKHRLIRKAITFYSSGFADEELEMIEAALEMQQFSMKNTLVTFQDKYYEYGVEEDAMDRVLTMGGYDSAWLADLVAGYLMERVDDTLGGLRFLGMYRDDGNLVFHGVREPDELKTWLANFQARINEEVGGTYIEFTMDIWKPGQPSQTILPKRIEVVGTDKFPYLDMQMSFDVEDNLCFEVYTKPGYQSKYLNIGSSHAEACKKAVPRGVSIRLAGLTTRTAGNQDQSLSKIYPHVHDALQQAGYVKGSQLPRLSQILDTRESEIMENQLKKEKWNKDRKRNVYCLSRFDGHWRTPIHKTIHKLRNKRGLKWLRVRMVTKRHQNLKEMLLGDIQQKCMKNIQPEAYVKATAKGRCNCRSTHKIGGQQCHYKEECETTGVIYRITCKCCNAFYLGKTQRKLKCRCMEHYQDVGKYFRKREKFLAMLKAPLPSDSPALQSGINEGGDTNSVRTTRSQTRAQLQNPQSTPSQIISTPEVGMNHLLSLLKNFSQPTLNTPLPPVHEDTPLGASTTSNLRSVASSTRPLNLTNNPNFTLNTSNQPTIPTQQSDIDSIISDIESQASLASPVHPFMEEFRKFVPGNIEDQARTLEEGRATILAPFLESDYDKIECSQLSKHMWSHAKDKTFANSNELYSWVRHNWDIEIVARVNSFTAMKTAGTKNCSLCMQERVKLFYAFHDKNNKKLMNSRKEMYGKCTCKTRFTRLSAVGNAGADEILP